MALLLIVDDNEQLLFLMRRALERFQHEIIACGDGASALAAIEAAGRPVDLVIADIELPDMSGRELVHHVRNSVGCGGVLYISGDPNADAGGSAMIRDRENFLVKPFTLPALLARIDILLQDMSSEQPQATVPPTRADST